MSAPLTREQYVRGVLAGDRVVIARAITLIESTSDSHRGLAEEVLDDLLAHTGKAIRVGITGVPGVGKSTLIDTLGTHLTKRGRRVAVLAVDPSSTKTGGSILGDKTRMARLSVDPGAFVRPSPTGGALGGVAHATREAMRVCEAAGYDVVLVETVGVGQSEIAVADMVDVFAVLLLPGGGDELQGMKKGLLELADVIAVNKHDGETKELAASAVRDYRSALRIVRADPPVVLTVSAAEETGIAELWDAIAKRRDIDEGSGALREKRAAQQVRWLWSMLEERAMRELRADPAVAAILPTIERDVREQRMTPARGVATLLGARQRAGSAG